MTVCLCVCVCVSVCKQHTRSGEAHQVVLLDTRNDEVKVVLHVVLRHNLSNQKPQLPNARLPVLRSTRGIVRIRACVCECAMCWRKGGGAGDVPLPPTPTFSLPWIPTAT